MKPAMSVEAALPGLALTAATTARQSASWRASTSVSTPSDRRANKSFGTSVARSVVSPAGKTVSVRPSEVLANTDSAGLRKTPPDERKLDDFKRYLREKALYYTVGFYHDRYLRQVRAYFDDVSAIVFGHSHRPINRVVQGAVLFNPEREADPMAAGRRRPPRVEGANDLDGVPRQSQPTRHGRLDTPTSLPAWNFP